MRKVSSVWCTTKQLRLGLLMLTGLFALSQLVRFRNANTKWATAVFESPWCLNNNNNNNKTTRSQEKSSSIQLFPIRHPSLSNYNPSFEPIWACQTGNTIFNDTDTTTTTTTTANSNNARKLIFVHVFKTAGSTFRVFFEQYGAQCHRGVTILIGCSNISASSLHPVDSSNTTTELWTNQNAGDPPCTVKSSWNRRNHTLTAYKEQNIMSNAFFEPHETDILIGHLPLGVHVGWKIGSTTTTTTNGTTTTATPIQPTYMTFVREPVAKYVSSRLYVYYESSLSLLSSESRRPERLTEELALKRIHNDIVTLYQDGRRQYNAYTRYLLTPEQKEQNLSPVQQVETILRNLIELPTVIGVVERMGDSLELLKHLIDPTGQVTESIDAIRNDSSTTSSSATFHSNNNMNNNNNNQYKNQKKMTKLVKNKSIVSTTNIVTSLRNNDTETYMMLLECLQLERQIYDFALQVHERQVEWLKTIKNHHRPVQ